MVTESDPRILFVENTPHSKNSKVIINNVGSSHSIMQSALSKNNPVISRREPEVRENINNVEQKIKAPV